MLVGAVIGMEHPLLTCMCACVCWYADTTIGVALVGRGEGWRLVLESW